MKLLRDWFYAGLTLALAAALFLTWLWQPQRQVERHSRNFLRAVSAKDWKRANEFIADDYTDQWHNDRARLLENAREVFASLGQVELACPANPVVEREGYRVHWRSRITISGQRSEMLYAVQERLNSLVTPFDLEWRHASAKPWDWKLVHISNPQLALPEISD